MERYRENPNTPSVRFISEGGRVIPLISGDHHGIRPRVASTVVRDQLSAMSSGQHKGD